MEGIGVSLLSENEDIHWPSMSRYKGYVLNSRYQFKSAHLKKRNYSISNYEQV